MDDRVARCGRYAWLPDHDPIDRIAEPDRDAFVAQHTWGRIYHHVGVVDGFAVLRSRRDESYRVAPEAFVEVPWTDHHVGDEVRVLTGSQAGATARIVGMGWHFKRERILYVLEVDGRRRSRWYWDEDIEPVGPDAPQ